VTELPLDRFGPLGSLLQRVHVSAWAWTGYIEDNASPRFRTFQICPKDLSIRLVSPSVW
jgi:hypothetical protein